MSQPPQNMQPAQGGGGRGGFGCTECLQNTPAVTRSLILTILIGSIVGMFAFTTTANCPWMIVESNFIQFYRLLVSNLLEGSILNGLFGCLVIWQTGSMIEGRKGSMFLLHAVGTICLLSNLLFFVVMAAFQYLFKVDVVGYCMYGSWPIIFGLMGVETRLVPTPTRQFMCCPCMVPTKWYPLILLAIFSILSFQPQLFFGCAIGYLYAYVERLHPSVDRLRGWEISSRMRCLTGMSGFIGIDNASDLPWSPLGRVMGDREGGGQQQPQGPRNFGGGALGGRGNIAGFNNGGAAAAGGAGGQQGQQPSVFAGQGHRLGQGGAAGGAPAAQAMAPRAGAAAADPSVRVFRPGSGAAVADRFDRLARGGGSSSSAASAAAAAGGAGAGAGARTQTSTTAAAAAAGEQKQPQKQPPPPQQQQQQARARIVAAPRASDTDNADAPLLSGGIQSSDVELQDLSGSGEAQSADNLGALLAASEPGAGPGGASAASAAAPAAAAPPSARHMDAVALFQHNMRSLQALGYSHADSLNALRVNGGNLELAIDFLTAATR